MGKQEGDSCFVKVLSHYVELTESERDTITALEDDQRYFAKGKEVISEGESLQFVYIVSSGQLYSTTGTLRATRLVTAIHHAGDCIGFHDLGFSHTTMSVTATVDSSVCAIRKPALGKLTEREPRLFALLMALATRDQVILIDRLRCIAKLYAKDRVLHTLLHLLHRQRVTMGAEAVSFRLPMNQHLLGDYLALTNVSVSNALSTLEREGVIERSGVQITLCDVDKSATDVAFVDRFAKLDTDWMETVGDSST